MGQILGRLPRHCVCHPEVHWAPSWSAWDFDGRLSERSVPPHLHGKSQHKTLQARMSEDIITRRDHSLFFRTAPGRFFLREFLTDSSLPEEFRRPSPTRRRVRELQRGPALAIDYDSLRKGTEENAAIRPQKIYGLLKAESYRYDDPRNTNTNCVFVRSFVCVRRNTDV